VVLKLLVILPLLLLWFLCSVKGKGGEGGGARRRCRNPLPAPRAPTKKRNSSPVRSFGKKNVGARARLLDPIRGCVLPPGPARDPPASHPCLRQIPGADRGRLPPSCCCCPKGGKRERGERRRGAARRPQPGRGLRAQNPDPLSSSPLSLHNPHTTQTQAKHRHTHTHQLFVVV
jgi:hypothetical protein